MRRPRDWRGAEREVSRSRRSAPRGCLVGPCAECASRTAPPGKRAGRLPHRESTLPTTRHGSAPNERRSTPAKPARTLRAELGTSRTPRCNPGVSHRRDGLPNPRDGAAFYPIDPTRAGRATTAPTRASGAALPPAAQRVPVREYPTGPHRPSLQQVRRRFADSTNAKPRASRSADSAPPRDQFTARAPAAAHGAARRRAAAGPNRPG
jgi:hypothetical protein